MVYDLRYKLFNHLQALGLHHHITTSTSDAVYRVDIDAYSIENLVMSGVFPLATSVTSLVVMFSILAYKDVTIALLSLAVMPFLYLCLRYYAKTLVNREERVKELESKLLERLYETFSAMRLVKSFAREPYEADRYARAGEKTMTPDRDHVAAIDVLGRREHRHDPRPVCARSAAHVMSGELNRHLTSSCLSWRQAPLSSIAHTTGQPQGAWRRPAGAMFALIRRPSIGTPSTLRTWWATSGSRASASTTLRA
jgi:ABC-type multidrug transport system fused ATPase/permease subunit